MAGGEIFNERQDARIRSALDQAFGDTGLTFSVLVGNLVDDTRGLAERLHGALPEPDESVLVVVQPGRRLTDVVTGARSRLTDREVTLAIVSMTSAFGSGDLTNGITTGVLMLAESAGKPDVLPQQGLVNPPPSLLQRLKR